MTRLDFETGLALMAAIAMKPSKRSRSRGPKPGEPHFIQTQSGTIYHVDAKGTRRRATDEEVAAIMSRLQHATAPKPTPNSRPCIHELKPGDECTHPVNAPIHAPAQGCTADGDRCDHPEIHHTYTAEIRQ